LLAKESSSENDDWTWAALEIYAHTCLDLVFNDANPGKLHAKKLWLRPKNDVARDRTNYDILIVK